ncbi:uncharacterized protein MKK02DRAFT_22296 [Dioszegia hungarica]|uniref:HSF-type DNA-binding domain-containing protein n=1 Tax=Dioszegia hungarica TaxID=4972 RepID=A0AA38HDV2_9TREE|nr:uncharacterized protein MKK02DRAFT_22296 [Dioszegia hungarica]KAI9638631.1 hypothetical protein MKK02DRAFT_22296 [Dioszegia hungarica]
MVDEVDVEEPGRSASAGAGAGAGTGGGAGGIKRNGLSVDENGEVTKVPAFLTKLFSMVSDQDTNALIYWSPKGDSFLIPHQEELAKKIFPRYFKHSNFQSFVRQLNMYAFHKVPHTSITPTGEAELWEFINPLFKRDHPELLGKITRQQRAGGPPAPLSSVASAGSRSSARQAQAAQTQVISPGGTYHPLHLITDGTTQGEANMVISPQGMLELSAITSGIAAIQRTQASIGADLKALQSNNELLWREAMEQREKHKKHQETIDLIVSFLERLFGTDGEGLKGLKEAMRRSGLARAGGGGSTPARKKRRLGMDRMIGDGREEDGLMEISSAWDTAAGRFTTLPSDGEPSPLPTPGPGGGTGTASTTSNTPSDPYALALAPYYPSNSNAASNPAFGVNGTYAQTTNGAANINGNVYDTHTAFDFDPTSSHLQSQAAQAASAYNLDPSLLQTTIGSLLQSPAAAQMFLNSLKTSAQAQHLPYPNGNGQGGGSNGTGNGNGNGGGPDPTLALFNPLPSPSLEDSQLLANQAELMRNYENAIGVGGDVERMQKGIDELVRSMGLDVGAGALEQGQGGGSGLSPVSEGGGGPGGGPGAGVDTSLDEIFGVPNQDSQGRGSGRRVDGVESQNGRRAALGQGQAGQPELDMDIPDGFDVDQFLKDLQED